MILDRTQLRTVTSSDHIYPHSFGLTLSKVEEVIGTPTIKNGEVVNTTTETVEMYQDLWQLSSGTYEVRFNESVTFNNDQIGLLLPSQLLSYSRGTIKSKIIEGTFMTEITGTMKFDDRCRVAPDTPVAVMVVYDDSE